MNYYPFHIGDYASHTRNLSLLEDLAYRRLLDAYYLAERPLNGSPTDVARSIGMRDHIDEVEYVLKTFFELDGDAWRNHRADKEIAHFSSKRKQASNAGKASAQRKVNVRSTSVEDFANGRSTNQNQNQNQEKIHTPIAPKGADVRFAKLWDAYPKKIGKDAARRAFDKRNVDDALLNTMLEAISKQKKSVDWLKEAGQFIPHPATWLNQGRWQDEEGMQSVGDWHKLPAETAYQRAQRETMEGLAPGVARRPSGAAAQATIIDAETGLSYVPAIESR